MKIKRLGEILVDSGVLTNEDIEKALAMQKGTNKRLGEVLIDENFISETDMIEALRMQLGIDFIDLTKAKIDASLTSLIPKNIAKQYRVVPVKLVGDRLYVAMDDPLNFRAVEAVKETSHKRVVVMIAYREAIDRALAVLYENEGAHAAIQEMSEDQGLVSIEERTNEADNSSAPTVKLVNSILERGIIEKASDVHIEPHEDKMVVRIRVDGRLTEILQIPKNLQNAVISRLKVMSNMNVTERRVPQDGRAAIRSNGRDIDMRVNTLPTIYGEKIVIRYLWRDATTLTRKGIGITDKDGEKFERIIQNSSGLILIVGPTGSGKTSTLYTIIQELNTPDVNMISLEDPVEYQIDGVTQVAINEKIGLTFAEALRACLRQDPDIICVGEIRDGETAEIAMRAAMTGHLVLSTLHTEDAVSAIDRLKDMGVEPFLISGSLRGVISQRLVRKICPECRQEVEPDPATCDLVGIPDYKNYHFFKGAGCHKCFNTGYKGRTGVFEILTMNSRLRDVINSNVPSSEIRKEISESDFTPMIVNARELAKAGVTTLEEVLSNVATIE
ncbi:MAG: Flp pilus assembly complex ATPase component TadA [Erysipelotrichaceae bacterium]|nr:Flp pilus assembly complex ATPase component TadA [Erysipelotrichaceae bacterium]